MSTLSKANHLDTALQLFTKNQSNKAIPHFIKHLQVDPNSSVAYKALGAIYLQQKNYLKAIENLENAHKYSSKDTEILNLLACSYMEMGNHESAHNVFNLAIRINPEYVDAIYNLGLLYYRTNNFTPALNAFTRLLELNTDHLNGKIYKAFTLEALQNYKAAEIELTDLLKQYPTRQDVVLCLARCLINLKNTSKLKVVSDSIDDLAVQFNIANTLLENELAEEALEIYSKIKPSYPDKASLLNNMATAYDRLDNIEKSIELYKEAIKENPNYAGAYSNIGRVLSDTHQYDLAESYLKNGLEIDPNSTNAYINLGRVYELQALHQEAIKAYESALSIDPKNPIALYNIGNGYKELGQPNKSIDYYKQCLTISPDYEDAEFNLGVAELTMGHFTSAWGHYFKRFRFNLSDTKLSAIQPGLDYKNKHVYLRFSQGLGDELFFLRFLPALKAQGAKITYCCQNKLQPLLKNNSNIDNLITEDDETPKCDYYFAIDDIPLILNMNSVEQIPPAFKLNIIDSSKQESLAEKYHDFPRPYIGITWRAGTQTDQIDTRSQHRVLNKTFSLDALINCLKDISGTVFILQRNPTDNEIHTLKERLPQTIIDTSALNDDLSNMAELLNFLDDSVCVSNTNIHILAGLEKTAKIIVPHPPEWRWMEVDSNSPWFPNMDTFRQSDNKQWDIAIEKLQTTLNNLYSHNA